MARMKGAGRKPGFVQYNSGPANTPVYVFVDGVTGETRFSTEAPRCIRVTDEELDELKDEDGYIGSEGVEQLCDYHDRVRVVEAGDLSTTRSRVADMPVLPADFAEEELRDFHKACEELLSKADWGRGCDKCQRKCGRCEALETGTNNAGMALSFMRMAQTCTAQKYRSVYDAASRSIASSEHPVRSSKDFVDEGKKIPKSARDRVNELIDQHALHGNFKSEYEAQFKRCKLRIGKDSSRTQKYINVLCREDKDAVFCPDAKVAHEFAGVAGLDKKAQFCSRCSKPLRFEDEAKDGPFARKRSLWPYVREVKHGYYVVDLEDLDVDWGVEDSEVGEEEPMWEVLDAENGGRKRARR